ncbi:MAG: DUF2971 domain-containing protein [Halomonas sp.]|nr:DUF2971 domain-containing protein [Halomonas sp.]MCC5904082.1 DUF2971 domain-containing protein [Halomonas sp.]
MKGKLPAQSSTNLDKTYYFFKYKDINKYGKEEIRENKIYFSTHDQLNDLFEMKSVRRKKETRNWKNSSFKTLEALIEENLNQLEKEALNTGIYSLSRSSKNQVLWSQYANNHKGVCIIYTIDRFNAHNYLWKVNYSKARPEFEVFKKTGANSYAIIQHPHRHKEGYILKSMTTKHTDWSHEREFRIMNIRGRIKSDISIFGLKKTAIIIGCNINEDDKKWIFDNKPIHCCIYQSSICLKSGNLKFKKILSGIKQKPILKRKNLLA